jgi:hypothetical protein
MIAMNARDSWISRLNASSVEVPAGNRNPSTLVHRISSLGINKADWIRVINRFASSSSELLWLMNISIVAMLFSTSLMVANRGPSASPWSAIWPGGTGRMLNLS